MGWFLGLFGSWVKSEATDVANATVEGAQRLAATGKYYGREAYRATASAASSVATAASQYVPALPVSGARLSLEEIREKYRPELARLKGDGRTPEQQRREEALLRELKSKVTDLKIILLAEKEDMEDSIFFFARKKKYDGKNAKLDVIENLSKANSVGDMYSIVDRALSDLVVIKGRPSRTKKLLLDIKESVLALRREDSPLNQIR